jgi:hypothetical protein
MEQGNAASNIVNKMDEPAFAATYLSLFDQLWNDTEKLEDVTAQICDHISSVYQENSPKKSDSTAGWKLTPACVN